MNLFCFSLEGSMDSLYVPAPEQRAKQESISGRTGSPISSFRESGKAHNSLFMEVSNFENVKPKVKSIQRSMSENKGFDLNEDGFLSSNNVHALQGEKQHAISYQAMKSSGDPVESVGTLKRLQKLVRIKKARAPSLDEMKPPLINLQDEDTALISCMKLAKSQGKKVNFVSTRKKEKMEIRLHSLPASLVISNTSTGGNLAEMLSHNEGEVQMYNNWKPFPENTLWTCADLEIAQVGPWDNCFRCNHHPHLKSSFTDMDLPHSWEFQQWILNALNPLSNQSSETDWSSRKSSFKAGSDGAAFSVSSDTAS